jgi:hypothetical protein
MEKFKYLNVFVRDLRRTLIFGGNAPLHHSEGHATQGMLPSSQGAVGLLFFNSIRTSGRE